MTILHFPFTAKVRLLRLASALIPSARRPERTMHSATLPDDDLIDHEPQGCVCGPTLELVCDGDVWAWVLVHHRLDGR